tara:strand:- start:225 stop:1367 length:1143 start_codon:yes stop_codon:yes gene_type:complete
MINIFQPKITEESLELVKKVFESNWLGRGSLVSEFELELSKYLSIPKSQLTTMSCCSDAIFAIIKLLSQIDNRKTIIIPSISFPAIGSSIKASNCNLKIVDVDAKTGNICLDALSKAIDDDTLAVFYTHYGGIPVDSKKVRDIVGDEVYLLEDSACAFGSFEKKGVSVGKNVDFSCWSFDAMKLLVAGEGGAAYIKDKDLMNKFKEYLYLGLPSKEKSGLDKASDDINWWEYELNCFGTRSVFTDINAAIALPQFHSLDSSINRRNETRKIYIDAINKNNYLDYSSQEGCYQYSNYFFTVLTEFRDELARYMKKNEVYCTFRYYPLHRIDLFKDSSMIENVHGAETFANRALNIPIHQNLTNDEIAKIASLLKAFSTSSL